jgi:malic enzyme
MTTMNEACTDVRPIVFAMSNPYSKMEVEASDAVRWTNGRVIYASGSPQPPVSYGGSDLQMSQANNMYIFPGIALGAWLGATRTISDLMLMTAAEKLPELISEEDLALGLVYPRLNDIRQISACIAASVIKAAAEEGKARGKALEKVQQGDEPLMRWLRRKMFEPKYASLVQLPVGVMQ